MSILLTSALVFSGCGAKQAMEGAGSDSTSEYGSVNDAGGPSGQGDSTSFNSDDNVEKVDTYVVRYGDNLWNIAAKASVYHSGWLYPLIVKANRSKIKDPKDLKIGISLKIPRGLSTAEYEIAREEAMAGTYDSGSAAEHQAVEAVKNGTASLPVLVPKGSKPLPRKGGGFILWSVIVLMVVGGLWLLYQRRRSGDASQSPG